MNHKPALTTSKMLYDLLSSILVNNIVLLFFISLLVSCSSDDPLTPDLSDDQVLVIAPESDSLFVNEAKKLKVYDQQGNRIDPEQVTWSSDSPDVISVTSQGVVRALSEGKTNITAFYGETSGQAVIFAIKFIDFPVEATEVSGFLQIPESVNADLLYISSGVGGTASVDSNGIFTIEVATDVETVITANHGEQLFGLGIVPQNGMLGKYTASLGSQMIVDPTSTATALIYMNPLFSMTPPNLSADFLNLIGELTETEQLANVIERYVSNTGALPTADDNEFVNELRVAVEAALVLAP